MKILIKLRDKSEIETEIEQEEYEELKQDISAGKIKFLNMDNRLLKIDQVISIEPTGETIPKSFRLEQPKFEKVESSGRMKELWNLLKSKELFKDFVSYEKFKEAKSYQG